MVRLDLDCLLIFFLPMQSPLLDRKLILHTVRHCCDSIMLWDVVLLEGQGSWMGLNTRQKL